MPGSDVCLWKGWGGERVPFGAHCVCVCVQFPASEETLSSNQPWFSFPCSGLTGGAGSEPWATRASARFPDQTREERCPGLSCCLQLVS